MTIATTIFLYIFIVIASAVIAFISVGFIYPKISFTSLFSGHKQSAYSMKFIKLGIAFTVLISLTFIIISIKIKQHQKITNEQKALNRLSEIQKSFEIAEEVQKNNISEKKANALKTVQIYLDAHSNKDIKTIDSLYVFPLKKYYTFYNVSKEKVDERTRYYWRHNSVPKIKITNENTHFREFNDSNIVVNIKLSEVKNRSTLLTIKLNGNLKIYSVGNYYLTENEFLKDTIK